MGNNPVNKTLTAAVEPVESDNPNGEFKLILSKDNADRDDDNLWADQWMDLPAKVHMDTDHAWAKGMSVPYTAGSGKPSIAENGDLVVEGTYASTKHAQDTRALVTDGHIWQASVSYAEHEQPDGTVMREILNGTFCGVPSNTECVVLSSKSMEETVQQVVDKTMHGIVDKATGGTTDGQYDSDQGPFADPKNRKWPLNSASRVRNAWARIHSEASTVNYSDAEISAMKGRIRSAAKRTNVTLSDEKSVKALAEAVSKGMGMLNELRAAHKDFRSSQAPWIADQQPNHAMHATLGEDVGASSVYDDTGSDEDQDDEHESEMGRGPTDFGDIHTQLAQAVHDASCALGAACSTEQDAMTATQKSMHSLHGFDIVVAGAKGHEVFSLYKGGEAVAHGVLKDFVADAESKGNPGRPSGPYQGVEGMSGENASGTDPGSSIEGDQLFLEGTAGPAIEPGFKSVTADDGDQQSLPASTEKAAAADNKSAAAASPADAAARARARVRVLKMHNANQELLDESETKENG
jgi:hypothetical protein